MGARRITHPQGCFVEPVFLSQPLESFPFSRTYIKATEAPANDIGNEAFWRAARHAKQSPAWRYHEIATNHMVANNRPEESWSGYSQTSPRRVERRTQVPIRRGSITSTPSGYRLAAYQKRSRR
jgi:hypothetical protein